MIPQSIAYGLRIKKVFTVNSQNDRVFALVGTKKRHIDSSRLLRSRDVHGNGNGNPMGMGIKHRIGNGKRREWETTSMRMGITFIDFVPVLN